MEDRGSITFDCLRHVTHDDVLEADAIGALDVLEVCAKLIGRNLWDSCGQATLDDWLARMGPNARLMHKRRSTPSSNRSDVPHLVSFTSRRSR